MKKRWLTYKPCSKHPSHTMHRQQPLDTLIGLARDQLDHATRELGGLQQAQLSAENQLAALENYLSDYRLRLQNAVQSGLSAAGWQNYQRFIGVLESAIAEQRRVVQNSAQELAQGQNQWRDRQRDLNAFDTLAQRRQQQQRQAAERRDQRLADEHAARMMQRRASRRPS